MPLSRYLKIYGCALEGCSLLFSTLKASLAYVPDTVVEAVRRGEEIPEEQEQALRALGMIVDDPEEERRRVIRFFEELNAEDKAVQASIFINLRCNFACQYCYEGNLKSDIAMAPETIAKTVLFLKRMLRPGKEELILYLYGGEPLLDVPIIERFASELKPFAESRGATFKFSLVTNASLLTRRTVQRLLPLGLSNAKVTLDGPKDTHDQSRPFKSGRGSFDTIVENIRGCSDLTRISVWSTFSKHNYERFPALLDHLIVNGLGPETLKSITYAPVQTVNDEFSTREHNGGCSCVNEPWITDATLFLRKASLERGFENPAVEPTPCMVDMNDALVIHVDGTITKCPALIGHKRFVVGTVEDGIGDFNEIFEVGAWKNESDCLDCEYLPLCFGGCRMMIFQRQGMVRGVDCKRVHYDSLLERLLKQELEYANRP